jgi:tetratricopeptide (TPR) repeat protein
MPYETPWARAEKLALARYVTPLAGSLLGRLPLSRYDHRDARYEVIRAIYNSLCAAGIQYDVPSYRPSRRDQDIRTPAEILDSPGRGTCLDLAALFCGLCLANELLPWIIVLDGSHFAKGHALAAVSLNQGIDKWNDALREGHGKARDGVLDKDQVDVLRSLVHVGAYIAIECTGFAKSEDLARPRPNPVPESVGREPGTTLMTFERAAAAGREQLAPAKVGDADARPFRFALDIARVQYEHPEAYKPYPVDMLQWAAFSRPAGQGLLPGLDRFVGREKSVDHVLGLLHADRAVNGQVDGKEPSAGLAAVHGLGGIGKTALVAKVVRRLTDTARFPDGIAVVDCADVTNPSVLLRLVLAQFTRGGREPSENDLPSLATRAQQLFMGKRAMVVLENVKPKWELGEALNPLHAAGVSLLLASRAQLSAVPQRVCVKLDPLPRGEALEVFAQHYGRSSAHELTRSEARAATDIIEALGAHTLAVKYMARYAAKLHRSLDRLAHELAEDPRFPIRLKVGDEAVQVVLASSYDALSGPTQRLFATLGSYATADIGLDAVRRFQTLPDGDLRRADEQNVLELVEWGLVDTAEVKGMPASADAVRVRLHPLVAEYARERFEGSMEADCNAVRLVVMHYYLDYTSNAPDASLELDERNIIGALEDAVARPDDECVARICNNLGQYWRRRDRVDEPKRFLPLALTAAQRLLDKQRSEAAKHHLSTESVDPAKHLLAILQYHYAELLRAQGDASQADKAKEYAHASLRASRAIGDRRGEALVLSLLGDFDMDNRDIGAAKANFERALDATQQAGDRRGEGVALALLGDVALAEGKYDEAKTYYELDLQIVRAERDRRGEGFALLRLGDLTNPLLRGTPCAESDVNDLNRAKDYYQRAAKIVAAERATRKEGKAHFQLAGIAECQVKYDDAIAHFRRSLSLFRKTRDTQTCATVAMQLKLLLDKLDRHPQERQLLMQEWEELTNQWPR